MIATIQENEIQLSSGLWIKQPLVRPGQVIENFNKKNARIEFELCTPIEVNGQTILRVVESMELHFNKENIEALIEVDGQLVDLLEHLTGDGAFVEEDVRAWGRPKFDDLPSWFEDNFGSLSFKEGPLLWLAKVWALNSIIFDGRSIRQLGFEWQ